jgi:hypothetical protein
MPAFASLNRRFSDSSFARLDHPAMQPPGAATIKGMITMSSVTSKLLIASTLVAVAFAATPALALCKYGTPHCINVHPGQRVAAPSFNTLPDGPPGNEDCKYYGNCDDGSPEGTGPDGGPNGGLGEGGSPALTGGQIGHFGHLSGASVLRR